MDMDTSTAVRAVHFSQSCVLILEHELTIPAQSTPGGAGAIFRAFNPIAKGFALHLPSTLGGRATHVRRSSSTDDSALQVTDESPSPRLGRRLSGARKSSMSAISPTIQQPLRSCLKTPQREIPPTPISPTIPGGFHHSPPPSPVFVRGRSMSRSTPPPNSVSTSPPPAPAHHLNIPTEIVPLQPCCDTCNEATDLAYSMGNAYRISWSPAAAAKKKRDDEEERGDILAGLKRSCNYKWDRTLDGVEGEDADDDGFCSPIPAMCSDLHAASCPPGSVARLDPLSKLDGLSRSPAASTSSLNKDWSPQKYYDSSDEDQDLFPLPSPSMSPQPSPVTGSPASSAVNLPSSSNTRPISPLVPTQDKFPPISRSHMASGQTMLGLPPIAGSAPASPAGGSARSSVASLSDAGSGRSRSSAQSHHSRGPSPIRVAASTNAARQHLDAPSIATASTGSSSRTGSSGRMWTTSFVPPPLPTRKDLQGRKLVVADGTGKSPLLASGGSKSLNLNATAAAKMRGERDRGERANPPPMPTYSGAQREFMIVASSKDRERERERGSASQQPPRQKSSGGEKALPPPPPIKDPHSTPTSENGSDFTPTGSRSGSLARRTGYDEYDFYTYEDQEADVALSRVPTATVLNTPKSARSTYSAQEEDQLGPLTSPLTSPAKVRRGGSTSQQPTPKLQRTGSATRTTTLEQAVAAAASSRQPHHRRSSTATDVVDENGVLRGGAVGGDSSRNRASSIKRLWKGIGNIASGVGAAAGAI